MFGDLFKNLPNFQNLFSQVNDQVKNIKATGEAAAGMVRVTVNGAHEIEEIQIDDDMMKPEEKEALVKLIKGAHNVAAKRVQEKIQENLTNLAGNIDPNLFKNQGPKS